MMCQAIRGMTQISPRARQRDELVLYALFLLLKTMHLVCFPIKFDMTETAIICTGKICTGIISRYTSLARVYFSYVT